MAEFTTGATIIPNGGGNFGPNSAPATLVADPGTGSVLVQTMNASGAWTTDAVDGTITDFSRHVLETANGPAIRVTTTGDAQYLLRWQE